MWWQKSSTSCCKNPLSLFPVIGWKDSAGNDLRHILLSVQEAFDSEHWMLFMVVCNFLTGIFALMVIRKPWPAHNQTGVPLLVAKIAIGYKFLADSYRLRIFGYNSIERKMEKLFEIWLQFYFPQWNPCQSNNVQNLDLNLLQKVLTPMSLNTCTRL